MYLRQHLALESLARGPLHSGGNCKPRSSTGGTKLRGESLGRGQGRVLGALACGYRGVEPCGIQRQGVQRRHLPRGNVVKAPGWVQGRTREKGIVQQHGESPGSAAGLQRLDCLLSQRSEPRVPQRTLPG
jgi:hypothetical protein